jgi:hypothetical protein
MMYGFPGERRDEFLASLEYVRALMTRSEWIGVTFSRFQLHQEAPMRRCPERFGIKIISPSDRGSTAQGSWRLASREPDRPSNREYETHITAFFDAMRPGRGPSRDTKEFQWMVENYSCLGFLDKCRRIDRVRESRGGS